MKLDRFLLQFNLSPNRQKIFKNVFWAMLGKTVNILSGLFVGVLVARYLGPDQFGLMNYVISYVTIFSILASFGMDNIEIRELSKQNDIKEKIMGSAFILRLTFALGTICIIIVSLLVFESNLFTTIMVMVYSLSLIFSTFNTIRNYFTSIVLNEYVVKTEIGRTIIGTGIKVVLLIYHAPLSWFIIASTFDFTLIAGGYLYSYRNKVGQVKDWKFDRSIAILLMKESYPLLLSGAAVIIYQKIDHVMIRNMIDNGSLGQFSVASKLTEFMIFLPIIIAQTIMPLLVQLYSTNKERYNEKKQQFMNMMVWSSIFMAFLVSCCSGLVITTLFGDEYFAAIPVLQIMAWKAVGMSLSSASGQLIIIEGLQRYAVIRNIVGCFVCVLLNLLLIPKWGIIGSAWATIATIAFSGYLSNYFIVPFRTIFKIQTISLYSGWRIIAKESKI